MEEKPQQMFKSKVCGSVQEVIFPDFPDDDNTVTTTVTKSRRVSFGSNFIKEFIVGSAVSAQCVSEYEQVFSSSDSSNPNSSISAVESDILNPPFIPENSKIHSPVPPIFKPPDFEPAEPIIQTKFSRTICFNADSPTVDLEFTEGCISLAKNILDKKNKEMTVIIQAKSKEPKEKREDVTRILDGSDVEMSMTRCLRSKENIPREEKRFESEKTKIFNKFDDEMSMTRCHKVFEMRQSRIADDSDFLTESSKENRMPLDLIIRQLDRDDSDLDLFNPEKSFNVALNSRSFDFSNESEKLNLDESADISNECHILFKTSQEHLSFCDKMQESVEEACENISEDVELQKNVEAQESVHENIEAEENVENLESQGNVYDEDMEVEENVNEKVETQENATQNVETQENVTQNVETQENVDKEDLQAQENVSENIESQAFVDETDEVLKSAEDEIMETEECINDNVEAQTDANEENMETQENIAQNNIDYENDVTQKSVNDQNNQRHDSSNTNEPEVIKCQEENVLEQSQSEPFLLDVKVTETLEEQSKETNCIWTLQDVCYPRSKTPGMLTINCTLLQSSTTMTFTLKKSKGRRIDSCSYVTNSGVYLKEDRTPIHPEYSLVLNFGFKKQEEFFSERSRTVTRMSEIPYFLDEINSFTRKINTYLEQVYEILISYPGSNLKGPRLSFRLFSYPMFFSSTVSIDLTNLYRLSDTSLSFKHDIKKMNENKISSIFQDCLKHKNCLCEFVIRSNKYLIDMERGTGLISKRNHIRLLPEELRVS